MKSNLTMHRCVAGVLLALLMHGCGLEHEIFGPLTDQGHRRLPEPANTIVIGQATGVAGGSIRFYSTASSTLVEDETPVDEDGLFAQHFSGVTSANGVVLWGMSNDHVVAGLLPELPVQETVFHEQRVIELWELHPALADLDELSTTLTLIVARAAHLLGTTSAALSPDVLEAAWLSAHQAIEVDDSEAYHFARIMATLQGQSVVSTYGVPLLLKEALDGDGTFLNAAWLAAAVVDFDGDGRVDTDTAVFKTALDKASQEIALEACFDQASILVIFQVDLRDGAKNLNCETVDHYKHAKASEEKSLFFTGAIHLDTPVCEGEKLNHCLTQEEIDLANGLLGDWQPNRVPMWDDGSHGDAFANDGIWTIVFELPYIPTATSPDGAGVRLGYKYTLGSAGLGWSNTEEWPGNQRILELEDLNGDHRVVRFDVFGDEAANKDKVNTLKPSHGGCGIMVWQSERSDGCAGDSRENQIDADGDAQCMLDAWPDPGPNPPLIVACD